MKLFIIHLIPLLCLVQRSACQNNAPDSIYFLDSSTKPCQIQIAKYLVALRKMGDNKYIKLLYHYPGPMISSESFESIALLTKSGPCYYYSLNGQMDSCGIYKEGRKNGLFYRFESSKLSVKWQSRTKWQSDLLIDTRSLLYQSDSSKIQGSLKDAFDIGDRLFYQTPLFFDKSRINLTDTTSNESTFEGGRTAWLRFLLENLQYPSYAINHHLSGTVILFSGVDSDGLVGDKIIFSSVDYSLDQEALRLLTIAHKRIPAKLNGNVTKSYFLQPITFRLQESE